MAESLVSFLVSRSLQRFVKEIWKIAKVSATVTLYLGPHPSWMSIFAPHNLQASAEGTLNECLEAAISINISLFCAQVLNYAKGGKFRKLSAAARFTCWYCGSIEEKLITWLYSKLAVYAINKFSAQNFWLVELGELRGSVYKFTNMHRSAAASAKKGTQLTETVYCTKVSRM